MRDPPGIEERRANRRIGHRISLSADVEEIAHMVDGHDHDDEATKHVDAGQPIGTADWRGSPGLFDDRFDRYAGGHAKCRLVRQYIRAGSPSSRQHGRPARIIGATLALTPGTRLGVYEITAQIGEGGMGQVYRATDTRLKRQVAIKILPPALAVDADRLARFQREAEVLASLNHPNIAAIYGLEDGGGMTALVMELVEGEDLAQRIARGAIPIDEALPIAKQIADALEAAHEQGIIHRDLKPANIKVRPDGTVKVLDFGLAKALEPAGGAPNVTQSPTITTPAMTQAGMILGTAAYMSPEQAKGLAADKRSDVWAYGCVLYEMLTGKRAFEGEDVSDTLAVVLRGEPDWSALPTNVSPAIVELIRGCVDKDRRRRIGDLSTARFILDHAGYAPAAPPAPAVSRIGRAGMVAVAVAATAAITTYATRTLTRTSTPSLPLARFTISLPSGDR